MDVEDYPLVSIGLPIYNRPNSLKIVLEQFINQTYKNIEIIISDNCSENKEVQTICEGFQKRDHRIQYIRQSKNIGAFANFNFVLQKAKGQFFMWGSDDDEFDINFIEVCLKGFKIEHDVILSSCLGKIYDSNKNLITKSQPDYNTIGLNKIERIRKISFYIQKSHAAFYCLHKTAILKKVGMKKYIDTDGLMLIELSQYGSFHRVNSAHFSSYFPNKENNSITLKKEAFININNLWPSRLLIKHENLCVYIFFSIQSLKWEKINFLEHFNVLYILYRSFWGYNTFKAFSIIRTARSYFNKKKIVGHITLGTNNIKNLKNLINNHINECECIILSLSNNNNFNNEISSLLKNYQNKIFLLKGDWASKQEENQFTLDYIKNNLTDITHCLIIDQSIVNNHILNIKRNIESYKYFNRALCYNNKLLIYPIKKYISFKNDTELTVISVELPKSKIK